MVDAGAAGAREQPNGEDEVTAEQLAARLGTSSGPVVVDVRTADEFADWAINGSRNVPLSTLGTELSSLDPDRDVVVVCASGSRGKTATDLLRSAGIRAVNLAGGMVEWARTYSTVEFEVGAARVVQVRRLGKGCLSYVVGAGGEAVVVDPTLDTARYEVLCADRGWSVRAVFDTHLHADHVSGARLLCRVTGARLCLNPAEHYQYPFDPVVDGDVVRLGGVADVAVLATPGHTPGSTAFVVEGLALLSGDTVFVDGVGRPDLADEAEAFARALYGSLTRRVLHLARSTLVLPGHFGEHVIVAPGVRVGASLAAVTDSVVQLAWDEESFVRWSAGRATPRPPGYREIIRVNAGESPLEPEACAALELGPNRCAA